MQNLNVRLLALVLALSAVTVGTTWAAPAAQDDEGVIEGYVFLDSDGDGELDLDEPGIEGLTLRLEGELNKSTKTDLAGGYGFSKLPDGDYTVSVEPGEDYATAELDSLEVTIEDGDVTSNVNFALREATDMAEDDTSADATADESTADATADDTTGDAATDSADMADATDSEASAVDAAAISALVQQMIDGMGEDASEEEVRAAFEQALAAARAEGTEDEMNAAIDQALASMASQDAADDDADEGSDADADHADDDAADDDADEAMGDDADDAMHDDAVAPVDDLPATGAGGPIGIGMLVVLILVLIGGLGRTMERRQSI